MSPWAMLIKVNPLQPQSFKASAEDILPLSFTVLSTTIFCLALATIFYYFLPSATNGVYGKNINIAAELSHQNRERLGKSILGQYLDFD